MGRLKDGQPRIVALFITIFMLCCSFHSMASAQTQQGCALGMPQPSQPFRVVWNHPDRCGNLKPATFKKYGIVFNKKRSFVGEEIQTLYRMGPWPTDPKSPDRGLPQLYKEPSFSATGKVLRSNWYRNFTGLGVFDWESWRAIYVTNFGSFTPYKTRSEDWVRERHPDWNSTMVYNTAEQEWQEGAKFVMCGKLAVAQGLMSGGYWGYYGYPRKFGGNQNDKIPWLWKQATGLYPSIYITNFNQSEEGKINRITEAMKESVRIQKKWSPPNTAIYMYSVINGQGTEHAPEEHLGITLDLPAKMGASGVVVWGSSGYYRRPGECDRVVPYVENVLGPHVKRLTEFMANCSEFLCGRNGRCIHNLHDTLISEEESERLSASCTTPNSTFSEYHCRCYSFWEGDCCQQAQMPA